MNAFDTVLFPSTTASQIIHMLVAFGIIITLVEISGKLLRWDPVAVHGWAFFSTGIVTLFVAYHPKRDAILPLIYDLPPIWGICALVFVGATFVAYFNLQLLNAGGNSTLNAAQRFLVPAVVPAALVGLFWLWNQLYFWFTKT